MTRGERLLRRAARRREPVAFWHLGSETLVTAVLRRGDDEPLLLACAGVRAHALAWNAPFSPGLLEASLACAVRVRFHVAALDAAHLEPSDGDAIEIPTDSGTLRAARTVIDRAASGFRAAELRLVALTLAPAARASLTRFLGAGGPNETEGRSLSGDPLAAVSVAPDCEAAAASLGELLTVPVGMALQAFGMVEEA